MKTLFLLLCSFLILFSCNKQEENSVLLLEEEMNIIGSDPLFTNYVKSVEAQAKLTRESLSLNLLNFSNIIKNRNKATHACDIDKKIFKGDAEMEQLADHFCKVSIAAEALKNKFPIIKEMSQSQRLKLFKNLKIRFDIDKEAVKSKVEASEEYKEAIKSGEYPQQYKEIIENAPKKD